MSLILALLCTLSAAAPEQVKKDDDESAREQMLGPEDDLAEAAAGEPLVAPPLRSAGSKAAQRAGRTGEIADEVAVGSSQPTPENPRQGQVSNLIRGSLYLG